MKKILTFFVFLFFLLYFFNSYSDDQLKRLKNLFIEGMITEQELSLAISKIENNKKKSISKSKIKIKKISESVSGTTFEKLEFYLDNYRIYTRRPGAIFVDNVLTGDHDVILKDNFKSELTKEGKKYFELIYDKEELKAQLNYKGRMLINWTGKYVRIHSATFNQMQVYGYIPFHFYITRPGKKTIALNVDYFNKKIDKAVEKVKEELSIKYNMSIENINRILESQQKNINKELNKEINKVISKETEEIFKELTEKYVGKEIDEAITKEIEKAVGEEMAAAFVAYIEWASGEAIDDAVESELAAEINAAINEAIQNGVSEAAAAAAIEAMLIVYALGGTDADALAACQEIAGDACN